MFATYQSIN